MNIAPLYELRERLYACAAAGCAQANEDFRLKRALEGFEPLAKASKVFEKLYSLCGGLFAPGDNAALLAQCIALADAVAVTQGISADSCETRESANPADMGKSLPAPYSRIYELCGKIEKSSSGLANLSSEEMELISDRRTLAAFIRALGGGNIYLDGFAENILGLYGNSIVPMFKASLDMHDPKASGKAVEYIQKVSGRSENPYYLSLAQNAEAPQNIRIAAIEALGCDEQNATVLADMYSTEKGKIKNAALTALAGIDCAQSEEIFAKLLSKYKPSYDPYISESCGGGCTQYVTDMIKRDFDEKGNLKEGGKRTHEYAAFLRNKPFADEGFLICTKKQEPEHFNKALIGNIFQSRLKCKDPEPFYSLIRRLYEKEPEKFFKAMFFVRLCVSPESAVSDMAKMAYKHRTEALAPLSGLYFDEHSEKYCLDWRVMDCYGLKYPVNALCDEFPAEILLFLCDENSDKNNVDTAAKILYNLLQSCKSGDYERIKNSAVSFSFKALKHVPSKSALDIIADFYKDGAKEEYKGLTRKFITEHIKSGTYWGCKVDFIDKFPLSQEERNAEIKETLEEVSKLKGIINGKTVESVRNTQIARLEDYLNSH